MISSQLSAGLVLPTESLWQTGAGSGSLTQVEGLIYELANTHTLFSWTFSRKYIPASEVESRKTSGRLRVLTFLSSSSASLVHSQHFMVGGNALLSGFVSIFCYFICSNLGDSGKRF